jgi:hypothetical protein
VPVTIVSTVTTRPASCWIPLRVSPERWKYERTRGRRVFAFPT